MLGREDDRRVYYNRFSVTSSTKLLRGLAEAERMASSHAV